ncbi:MAG: hypothetical protein ABI782_09210 [Anaerolineaceae bacterium]
MTRRRFARRMLADDSQRPPAASRASRQASGTPPIGRNADLLTLQRSIGNQAVQRLLQREPGRRAEILRSLGARGPGLVQRRPAPGTLAAYEQLVPGQSRYAKRKGDPADFTGVALDGVSKALSLPRNPDGSLSDESISIMDKKQADEAQGYIDAAAKRGFKNAPTNPGELAILKKAVKERLQYNKVTGKTDLPELANLINPPKGTITEATVLSEITHKGIKLLVNHSNRDVNFKPRLQMFFTAIEKIQKVGFNLPGTMLVHLPKFGRDIDAQTLCDSGTTPRAVFNPPNFVHLSSSVVGNPIDSTIGDYYKNLSTELDPSGAGSVVHELGHMMHYATSASDFYSLHGTGFTAEGDQISARVSAYANQAPREFVAEVFMGLVYGRTFDDEVLDMYAGFGAPITAEVQRAVDKARRKGDDETVRVKPGKPKTKK